MIVGGGRAGRFALFGHVILGGGFASVWDYEGASRYLVGTRHAGAGVGGYARLHDRFSLGALMDFKYAGMADNGWFSIDTRLMLGFHL